MNRRGFLKTGAISAMASSIPGAFGQQNGAKLSPVRLGMASYTFRNFDRATVISYLKQLRIDTLNCKDSKDHLPSTSPEAEQKAIDAYKAAGIRLNAVGTISFPKDDDADIRAKFDYAKLAGVPVIVCDPAVVALPRLERFVKEYDIRLAIHNHGPEAEVFHSPLDVLKIVDKMDQRIGCCIDIGHAMRAGTSVPEAIKTVGPRLYNIHAKDLAKPDVRSSQVAVGAGLMPMRQIFRALIDMNYQWMVDLEYEENGNNPMPYVIESISYMRGVLDGMGYKS
jgi:sugar phosphate isomerase/epimerase